MILFNGNQSYTTHNKHSELLKKSLYLSYHCYLYVSKLKTTQPLRSIQPYPYTTHALIQYSKICRALATPREACPRIPRLTLGTPWIETVTLERGNAEERSWVGGMFSVRWVATFRRMRWRDGRSGSIPDSIPVTSREGKTERVVVARAKGAGRKTKPTVGWCGVERERLKGYRGGTWCRDLGRSRRRRFVRLVFDGGAAAAGASGVGAACETTRR